MKIAIVGTGISSLLCARLLHHNHDLTIFEANDYIGGHANTLNVQDGQRTIPIDTGFIVHNDRTYPIFSKILEILGVKTQPTTMSFSVCCERRGLEYNGTNLNGLFSQRANLFRPSFLRMIREILRFNRQGTRLREQIDPDMTIADFITEFDYKSEFVRDYLLPMGAAIWSCPPGRFEQFPIRFILDFYHNHGLLSLQDRPTWKIIRGGSQEYVKRLVRPFVDRIRLNLPVMEIRRETNRVVVVSANDQETFDEVILGCHSDQALRLLSDPTPLEQSVLTAFPYTISEAILHTDESLLPRSRRAWAAWNYRVVDDENQKATVTYNINRLQGIDSQRTFLLTLNQQAAVDPRHKIARFNYAHPIFTANRAIMQAKQDKLIRQNRTSFCGAWWGAGFHEDGASSALAVCQRFGIVDWSTELRQTSRDRIGRFDSQPTPSSAGLMER